MRLLLITVAYPPYIFSESLCNAKLALNLQDAGIHVDVISRVGMGPAYDALWGHPWLELKENVHEVTYPLGSKLERFVDVVRSGIELGCPMPVEGLRWARRALSLAMKMHRNHPYDAVLTRSPSDIPHLVGRMMKRKTGVRWIANWNDPAFTIWPKPYEHEVSSQYARRYNKWVKSCLREATLNTFPSKQLLEHFKEMFPECFMQNAAEVVPHVQLPKRLFHEVEPEKTHCLRMCHAGNLSVERNPVNLFRGIKQACESYGCDIRLYIMGQYSEDIEKLAKVEGVADNVSFIPSCAYMESLKKLQEFDVLVLVEAEMEKGIYAPSKLTDYAQCNRPILVVSPRMGYARNLSQLSEDCVFVDNQNVQDIANGIIALHSRKKEGVALDRTEGLSQRAGYTGEQVVDIYRKILNKY